MILAECCTIELGLHVYPLPILLHRNRRKFHLCIDCVLILHVRIQQVLLLILLVLCILPGNSLVRFPSLPTSAVLEVVLRKCVDLRAGCLDFAGGHGVLSDMALWVPGRRGEIHISCRARRIALWVMLGLVEVSLSSHGVLISMSDLETDVTLIDRYRLVMPLISGLDKRMA